MNIPRAINDYLKLVRLDSVGPAQVIKRALTILNRGPRQRKRDLLAGDVATVERAQQYLVQWLTVDQSPLPDTESERTEMRIIVFLLLKRFREYIQRASIEMIAWNSIKHLAKAARWNRRARNPYPPSDERR
jgi:hypothetical protein